MTEIPFTFKQNNELVEGRKKPIEFVKFLGYDLVWSCNPASEPKEFDHISPIAKYGAGFIMYAYDNGDEENGCIYWGYWNDGVKE